MNLKNHILITQSLINIFESRQLNIENQDTSDLYNILENELKALASMHIEVNDIINLYKKNGSFVEKKQTFNESKAQDKALTAFFVSIIVIDGFYDKWKCYKKAWYIGWFIFKPYGKSYIAQRLYQLQNAKKKLLNIIRSGQDKDTNTIKDAFEMTPMKHFYMK
ncbi:unnamed protein product [Pneumocystis jirovecii]|uniref:Uncharacterized protein n=1 Tax=Pneumocystis jirovecii TaxID=42068 RepID=L0PGB0_PNEJI|nr:unnamed protein product [Pneumocystis jirovecii]